MPPYAMLIARRRLPFSAWRRRCHRHAIRLRLFDDAADYLRPPARRAAPRTLSAMPPRHTYTLPDRLLMFRLSR